MSELGFPVVYYVFLVLFYMHPAFRIMYFISAVTILKESRINLAQLNPFMCG
jgi:hypothetical protein